MLRDAAWVVLHRPGVYLRSVAAAWEIYFRSTGDVRFLGAANIAVLRPVSDAYDTVFFGRWSRAEEGAPRYWTLLVGLPLLFAMGLLSALGRGPGRALDRPQRLL